ncbi:MAG: DNA primase [Saprospiraceae bacterium]|nr:DNA primase [Saprospiraceae bacterium]MCZ2337229.1 DNA primase [Chitinophagales bacterium]
MISQRTIQEVFNTAKVEDIISDFVNLRRRGVNLIGNCPFHDEKTPSFTVSPSKNIYKCFGCGRGGDSVRFIMEHEHISFPEAIRFIANKYKIEIEETEDSEAEKEKKEVTDSLYLINDFARDYYMDTLFNRNEGRNIGLSYFKERGFREATINKFQLGYATDERDEFTRKAVEKKYNIDFLRTLGLTTKSDADFFRARVMFTIHNVSGKVIAFAGRTLSADKKQPKYINSPESDIYNKRNILYGIYFAKEAIRKNDECILVEGYTDVISLHQGGIENVVASSGTSLTHEQVRLIKRFTSNIKILYDGDAAGINAALRGLDMVLEADMNVKLVLLPDGHDPDSFLVERGSEGFHQFIKDQEEDFIYFKTKILLKETAGDPIKKSIAIKDVISSIAKIPDTLKRSIYIQQCSELLDMREALLVSEVNKIIRANIKAKKIGIPNQPDPDKNEDEWLKQKTVLSTIPPELVINDAWQEKAVATILINYGHEMYDVEQNITVAQYIISNTSEILQYFDTEIPKKIIELVQDLLSKCSIPDHQWYTQNEDESIRNFAIDALTTIYVYADWDSRSMPLQNQKMPDENYIHDASNAILRLQLKKSKRLIAQIEDYLNNASDEVKSSEEYSINMKTYIYLIGQRNQIAEKLGTVTL